MAKNDDEQLEKVAPNMEVHLYTLPGLWVFAAPLKRTITIA
jgi:hypothetical protein